MGEGRDKSRDYAIESYHSTDPPSLIWGYNDRRCGETGRAMTWTLNEVCVGHGKRGKQGVDWNLVPSKEKFAGKWHGGEEPEGVDAAMIMLLQRNIEGDDYNVQVCQHMKKNPTYKYIDTVYWTLYHRWTNLARLPRQSQWITFMDQCESPWMPGNWNEKYGINYRQQWAHCIGNLGRDHPTCRKASWTYERAFINDWWRTLMEEYTELGHFDGLEKWGVKCRLSMLPMYQPLKKNIPGMYELARSEEFGEVFKTDFTGKLIGNFYFGPSEE